MSKYQYCFRQCKILPELINTFEIYGSTYEGRMFTNHLICIQHLKIYVLTLYHTITTFNDPGGFVQFELLMAINSVNFENIVGPFENNEEEKNAGNHHFLHFPQFFQPFPQQIFIFQNNIYFCLKNSQFEKKKYNILLSGKDHSRPNTIFHLKHQKWSSHLKTCPFTILRSLGFTAHV